MCIRTNRCSRFRAACAACCSCDMCVPTACRCWASLAVCGGTAVGRVMTVAPAQGYALWRSSNRCVVAYVRRVCRGHWLRRWLDFLCLIATMVCYVRLETSTHLCLALSHDTQFRGVALGGLPPACFLPVCYHHCVFPGRTCALLVPTTLGC